MGLYRPQFGGLCAASLQVADRQDARSGWIHNYIFSTVFPIVFVLAPTGVGLFGAVVANALYLVLDIYTKIAFNVQLASKA